MDGAAKLETRPSRLNQYWCDFKYSGMILLIPFAVLILAACLIGAGILKDRAIQDEWQLARGAIVAASTENCGKSGYAVRARYEYKVGDAAYAGDKRAAGTRRCASEQRTAQHAEELLGSSADIYFNPAQPSEAVLGRPSIHASRYFFLALVGLLIACAVGVVVHDSLFSPLRKKQLSAADIAGDAEHARLTAHQASPFK